MEILTRSSGYFPLFFILSYLATAARTHCIESCIDSSKEKTMSMCQPPASMLEDAVDTGNGSSVCIRFHKLLECVGRKVPQCLGVISEKYEEFTFSPWDCHLSNEQVISYQKLVENGCGSTSKSEQQSDPINYGMIMNCWDGQIVLCSLLVYILTF